MNCLNRVRRRSTPCGVAAGFPPGPGSASAAGRASALPARRRGAAVERPSFHLMLQAQSAPAGRTPESAGVPTAVKSIGPPPAPCIFTRFREFCRRPDERVVRYTSIGSRPMPTRSLRNAIDDRLGFHSSRRRSTSLHDARQPDGGGLEELQSQCRHAGAGSSRVRVTRSGADLRAVGRRRHQSSACRRVRRGFLLQFLLRFVSWRGPVAASRTP